MARAVLAVLPLLAAAVHKPSLHLATSEPQGVLQFHRLAVDGPPKKHCPKVYVYKLPKPWNDLAGLQLTQATAFGVKTALPHLYEGTEWNSLALIFLQRLAQPGSCYYTADPSQADLFFVPILPKPKHCKEIYEACKSVENATQLLPHLPYLTTGNRARHFLLSGTGWSCLLPCHGTFSNPHGLFRRMARVTVETILPTDAATQKAIKDQHGDTVSLANLFKDNHRMPRHYQAPYPSSVHFAGEKAGPAPWNSTGPRAVLASYVGSPKHGDVQVRQMLQHLCSSQPKYMTCESWSGTASMKLKQRSVFCLEPVGDSLGRKSTSDSVATGCIPVFFGPAQTYQFAALWSYWDSDVPPYVAIDRRGFLDGTVDLLKVLREIQQGPKLAAMQAQIAQHGGRFQYSLSDSKDALDALLRRLSADAHAANMADPPTAATTWSL